MFNSTFSKNRRVYEITWKNIIEQGGPQMTIWRMRIAYWISNATNAHSQYVIFNYFSTATMVARTRLNFTFIVHCLFCLIFYYSSAKYGHVHGVQP